MNERKEYLRVDSEYLAMGLRFIGYRFYKFNDCKGGVYYTFKIDVNLINDLDKLKKMKSNFSIQKRSM